MTSAFHTFHYVQRDFSLAACVTQIFDIWIFPHTLYFILQNKNPPKLSWNIFRSGYIGFVSKAEQKSIHFHYTTVF